ncbi:MAG: TerB family tellurite resistance protein [Bacteroidaceae bacterium]|nr:TerB family tellurite resistance protein [Bacteroidaceae bacterium]
MYMSKEIAILRLVIDLIKADNKMHREEISWTEMLSKRYSYTADDLLQVHNVSFQEAITILQQLGSGERNEVIELLREIISIDNDIDTNERILIAAILMALHDDTSGHVQVLTADARGFEGYDRQFIYLEKKPCASCQQAVEQVYASISRQLRAFDIDFFFYPRVLQHILHMQPHLTPAINLLIPTFSHVDKEYLSAYTTCDFTKYVHGLMGAQAEPFRFDAFFMLKIQSNHRQEHPTVDFLCIEISQQPTDIFNRFIDSLAIEEDSAIPFYGCYRTLFDMISCESKQNYDLMLDGDLFYLCGEKKIVLDIRGSERKTLFALFLLYGEEGISNNAFAQIGCDTKLGQEAIAIYQYFANAKNYEQVEVALSNDEEPTVIANLRDIAKRNSHIGYIKRAFMAIPSLKSPQLYYPQNKKGGYCYNIMLSHDSVKAKHHSDDNTHPFTFEFFV